MRRIKGPPQGPEELEINLRRSAQARRISLRVSGLDGQVTLTLPKRVAEAEGLAFAQSRADWIANAIAKVPQGQRAEIGALMPIEGVPHLLRQGGPRGPILREEGALVIPGAPELAGAKLAVWLKHLARRRLNDAVGHYAGALGQAPSGLTLRDTRSRWGSCTSQGALMFSWRLILAPPAVLNYVAAHEVAHLVEMNHSDRFWRVVARLDAGYEGQRQWLRNHGSALHAWRFA